MRFSRLLLTLATTAALARVTLAAGQGAGINTDVEIAGLLDQIEATTARQERFEREVADLSTRHQETRNDLKRQVRTLYRVTRAGLAPLAGGMDSVLRHVARVKRLRQVVQKQALLLGVLQAKQRSARGESSKAAQELKTARLRLSALQGAPQNAARALPLSDDGAAYRPAAESGSYGLRLVDPAPVATFDSERGNLASPVMGEVRIASARRAESDGPGLEFQAAVGTPVRAVAAGRVAFSDRYGSYGRLVILDHGGGYYTVYGGLGSVEVRVGDDLSRQARIGSIGTDFSPSALFFEVRKGTRTLEPRGWLGL
jgi:septal ring factor EnvC (AmiA/AmiB activator)